jgi:cobalamin synthase
VTLGGTAVFFSRSFERVWVSMAGKAPEQQWKLLPHVGLVIALVAGIVMLIGSAVTYRDRLRSRLN